MPFETDSFAKNDAESFEDYKIRCYQQKPLSSLTWIELTQIINSETGHNYSDTYYRKDCKKMAENGLLVKNDEDEVELGSLLKDLIREVKVERFKLTEERTQNNAYIRKLAREETLKEIAANFADKMSSKKQLYPSNIDIALKDMTKAGILCISDWHYGIECDNIFNKYNPQVCKQRVSQLRDEVIKRGLKEDIKKLYICNLSDLIAGRIHLTIRLESREDVISQVMNVSEILAEFINDLSQYFVIEYRDVMDNHSRLEPNKKDSIELETLVRIIPWYLKQRLVNNKNVYIMDNECADDIINFKVFNFNVAAVHGHKDKPSKLIDNMSHMLKQQNDLVLSAHLHHFATEEEHNCLRISNGSLMGVDNYAQNLRLTSQPCQALIIATRDNVADTIYNIKLN